MNIGRGSSGRDDDTRPMGRRPTRAVGEPPEIPGVRIVDEIAAGGMGVVYRGVQTFMDRQVAVKVLAAHLLSDEFYARFRRECQVLARIQHLNIVACYDAGETEEGLPYFVMEYVDGPTLREWTSDSGALPLNDALDLCADLARALGHAYEAGVIHRDVKAENVLLKHEQSRASSSSFPYVAKLVDFGIARPNVRNADDVDRTAPGMLVGTMSTMAPEQYLTPDQVDYRADLYGLGCVLFRALTGRAPFRGLVAGQLIEKKKDPPDVREVDPDLPSSVARFVQRLLAFDAGDRPSTHEEVAALCEAYAPEAATMPFKGPVQRGRTKRRRRRLRGGRLAVAGLLAAGLGAGGAYYAHQEFGWFQDFRWIRELVAFGPPANRPPTLTVTAPAQVTWGEQATLRVAVEDPDGDACRVEWIAPSLLLLPAEPSAEVVVDFGLAIPGSRVPITCRVTAGEHTIEEPCLVEVAWPDVDDRVEALFYDSSERVFLFWNEVGGERAWTATVGAGDRDVAVSEVPPDKRHELQMTGEVLRDILSDLQDRGAPAGSFVLAGGVEIPRHHFRFDDLATAGFVVSLGAEPVALSLGPDGDEGIAACFGAVAEPLEWPRAPTACAQREVWDETVEIRFRLDVAPGEATLTWGREDRWYTSTIPTADGEPFLRLVASTGLARFFDFRFLSPPKEDQ
ncbi:MAG: serine/threonine-protein kinase [Planctomycetota bacterium]